jgi:hypothetical protein
MFPPEIRGTRYAKRLEWLWLQSFQTPRVWNYEYTIHSITVRICISNQVNQTIQFFQGARERERKNQNEGKAAKPKKKVREEAVREYGDL